MTCLPSAFTSGASIQCLGPVRWHGNMPSGRAPARRYPGSGYGFAPIPEPLSGAAEFHPAGSHDNAPAPGTSQHCPRISVSFVCPRRAGRPDGPDTRSSWPVGAAPGTSRSAGRWPWPPSGLATRITDLIIANAEAVAADTKQTSRASRRQTAAGCLPTAYPNRHSRRGFSPPTSRLSIPSCSASRTSDSARDTVTCWRRSSRLQRDGRPVRAPARRGRPGTPVPGAPGSGAGHRRPGSSAHAAMCGPCSPERNEVSGCHASREKA